MARVLSSIAVALVATPLLGAAFIQSYQSSKPVNVKAPVMSDSVNLQGKKFEAASLLDTRAQLKSFDLDLANLATDTTGIVQLSGPETPNSYELQTLVTRIRADKYTKGNLKVTSTAAFEVWSDRSKLNRKASMQDTISGESTLTIPMELLPENTYELRITTVTDKPATLKAEFAADDKYENSKVLTASDLKQRMSLNATEMGVVCTSARVSPDGKYIQMVYRDKRDSKTTRRYSEIYDIKKRTVINSNVDPDYRWMPRGSKLYYTENNDGKYDLYTVSLPEMTNTLVAQSLPESSIYWSPNEDYILYYKTNEEEVSTSPAKRIGVPDDRIPGNRTRYDIMRYDFNTKVASPLIYCKDVTAIADLSRDGSKLLYTVAEQKPSEYPFYFTDLVQLDMNTMKTDTLIRHEGHFSGAIYSPDATQLLLLGGPSAYNGVGLQLSPDVIANDYDTQAFIFDIKTGNVKAISKNFDPAITGQPMWNAADNLIYFLGEEGFEKHVYTYNPKTDAIKRLNSELANVFFFSIGEDEKTWLTYIGGDFDKVRVPYLLNLNDGKSTSLADGKISDYKDFEFGDVQVWRFTASDGTEIDGRCILPPNFDPTKKYPLIVYYYGGTSPTEARLNSPYAPHVFASRDYVVYTLNPSGSTGYGQEFSARHVNAWGKRTSDDIIEGAKEFCKQHPFVDDKKIGCIGASYGGFMTQYLLTRTDLFAAGVSHAGISNVTSYWGEGYWGYSYNSVAAAKSYPWNNPDLFTKQGSLFNADKIHTPLLLLHGTADTNVPMGESVQIFNALKILGREVEFITVDGEDHYVSDYDKRVIWHNTIMAWFEKWLKDDPTWWDSMYK